MKTLLVALGCGLIGSSVFASSDYIENFELTLGPEWATQVTELGSWQSVCNDGAHFDGNCGYAATDGESILRLTLSNSALGTLRFHATSSTTGEFAVVVDGTKVVSRSGTTSWTLSEYVVPAGTHTIEFIHNGFGTAAVDSVSFEQDYATHLKVNRNPYAGVVWGSTYRLKTQLHDHVANNWQGQEEKYVRDYDAAGYDVISYMTYSGRESASYAWQEKRWPVEAWIPAQVLDNLQNIKFFIPNGEEMGFGTMHVISPLLTDYISLWEGGDYLPWNYTTKQELIDQIVDRGGLTFLAHPTNLNVSDGYLYVSRYTGVEIYSGYYAYQNFHKGEPDRNPEFVANWDKMLLQDSSVVGISVNDHIGPWTGVDMEVRDSGKVIVLAEAETMSAFQTALKNGAVFAIKDRGHLAKDTYPIISSIDVGAKAIAIEANGQVTWIANGRPIATGATLQYAELPMGTRYVRAEVSDAESTVYTQAFGVGPATDTLIVDIRPETLANDIKPASNELILVAALYTSISAGDSVEFDPMQIDTTTVRFGPLEAPSATAAPLLYDTDGDGDTDAIFGFWTGDTGIICEDTDATMTGQTYPGDSFIGADFIVTRDCTSTEGCHP